MSDINNLNNIQAQHERAEGNRFVEYYNKKRKCNYFLKEQPNPPKPDLIFRDALKGDIGIEVTDAYYNNIDAKGQWDIARMKTNRVDSECFVNFNSSLIQFINDRIIIKCNKSYEFDNVILIIPTRPALINDEQDFSENILPYIKLPSVIPFYEIYVDLDLLSRNYYFQIH